jgi:hypothetical protein
VLQKQFVVKQLTPSIIVAVEGGGCHQAGGGVAKTIRHQAANVDHCQTQQSNKLARAGVSRKCLMFVGETDNGGHQRR